MADVALAIAHVLRLEDATLSGVVTTDAGGRTRFGVAEKFHPWVAQIDFYTTTRQQALGIALAIYMRDYCLPMNIGAIPDQGIADKVLSLGINVGITYPAKWLQEAVGANPDGSIGPATIAAITRSDPKKALDSLKQQAIGYYHAVAQNHPEDAQYLNGWINRANA